METESMTEFNWQECKGHYGYAEVADIDGWQFHKWADGSVSMRPIEGGDQGWADTFLKRFPFVATQSHVVSFHLCFRPDNDRWECLHFPNAGRMDTLDGYISLFLRLLHEAMAAERAGNTETKVEV